MFWSSGKHANAEKKKKSYLQSPMQFPIDELFVYQKKNIVT